MSIICYNNLYNKKYNYYNLNEHNQLHYNPVEKAYFESTKNMANQKIRRIFTNLFHNLNLILTDNLNRVGTKLHRNKIFATTHVPALQRINESNTWTRVVIWYAVFIAFTAICVFGIATQYTEYRF
jgi:hypothetical protein